MLLDAGKHKWVPTCRTAHSGHMKKVDVSLAVRLRCSGCGLGLWTSGPSCRGDQSPRSVADWEVSLGLSAGRRALIYCTVSPLARTHSRKHAHRHTHTACPTLPPCGQNGTLPCSPSQAQLPFYKLVLVLVKHVFLFPDDLKGPIRKCPYFII